MLIDDLIAGGNTLSAAELELVVLAKLELSAIAQQRQHSAMAARAVHSAMKMLQSANFLSQKKTTASSQRRYSVNDTQRDLSDGV